MEIRKEHLQIIDDHFKNNGIKYWDLRIEMIDHLVSDIEQNSISQDFKSEFSQSLKRANWQGYLSGVNTQGWQNVNRKYRSEYHRGFIDFFKNYKNVSIFVIGFLSFYFISKVISFKTFDTVSLILFTSPLLIVFIEFGKSLFKKYGRSINLDFGVNYMIISFLILNMVPLFFDDQSELFTKIMWFIILPIHFVAFYSGYILYKKAIVKVEFMKKELST
jgi:hypothetical protein